MMRISILILAAVALAVTGCGSQPYPSQLAYPVRTDVIVARLPSNPPDGPPAAGKLNEFIGKINERGGQTFNPAELAPAQKAHLERALAEFFGTPAQPHVGGDAECQAMVVELQLQPDKLAAGSLLYKKHCLQCHGLAGDGRGPTGNWVYPFPRDFRQGIFKYVSSSGSAGRKPARADLQRLLANGIERTSMPSFSLVEPEEREQLIAYAMHLSIRGEVEYRLLLGLLSPNGEVDENLLDETRSLLKIVLRHWVQADAEQLTPAFVPTPENLDERVSDAHLESVRRGHQLFASQAVGCIGCHADYGRQARYVYDAWGGSVRPADLTEGAYHGGKRPIDLYQRIRGGIGPSGMPAATTLTEAQVWDLVHFVLAAPTRSMLPPDVREQVYPPGR